MKIVSIVGSLRKNSFNRVVFNRYRALMNDRVEMIEGQIANVPLYNEDIREAGLPDSVKLLSDQIQACDALLLFSPEYNYSIPGVVKNAFDWLSRVQPMPTLGKPFSVISASPGLLGGARMQYHLRQVAVALDLRMMNRPEVMISEVHKKISNGELTDEKAIEHLKDNIRKRASPNGNIHKWTSC